MPRAKKTTTRKKRTTKKTKELEFSFFTRIVEGAKKLFSPPK